jgi:integrase
MLRKMPKGDRWQLIDKDVNSINYNKKMNIDFAFLDSKEIKDFLKEFTWRNYKERNNTLIYIKKQVLNLQYFNEFTEINNITSLKDLSNNDIDKYISFLKTRISKKTNKPLSYNTQRNYLNALKSVIYWGQTFLPDKTPKKEIFTGNEYSGINKVLKTKYIPDEVIKKINLALINEENNYLKYGLIILQSTGMRISELLNLRIDCLKKHLISGWMISYYDYKKRKHRDNIPIPNECAISIKKLIDKTDKLRKQSNKDIFNNIFIHKVKKGKYYNKIKMIHKKTFKYWLNKFIKNNNITGNDGKIYNLTFHQFRRTLATDMYSKGVDILVIRDLLGHDYAKTTNKYYADIKDNDRAKVFSEIGILGDIDEIDQKLKSNKATQNWFKKNKNSAARMCDGYCTKPINEDVICERLVKKRKCYTCKHYITTPEYLEYHKNHLKDLQQELNNNIYGRHYADHIIPTIEVLKEIIKRLEAY